MKALATLSLLALCLIGCAQLKPGNDAIVVRAEQLSQSSLQTVNAFLTFEYNNRALLSADVTKLADKIRREYPKAQDSLDIAIRAYKSNRTAENKASIQTWSAVIDSLLASITPYIPLKAGMDPATMLLALSSLSQLLRLLVKEAETLQQDAEMTPEQEAEFDKLKKELYASPAWKPSDEV